ncbi:MAG: hypothetical protein KGH68_03030 [Patescibacteria group bacterium]|nr:hypothetical protein [Patescibacteria group bacterium]
MARFSKSTLLCSVLVLSFVCIGGTTAFAQSIPGISQPVTFTMTPPYPQPNSSVGVTAQSFSTDLNRASFSWYVDGKLVRQGTGIMSITVPVETSDVTVSVNVDTVDIGTISNSMTIHPGSVALLWQTDGYTPPFYQGKALEAYGSTFKVTAVPDITDSNGVQISPKNLVYTWQENGNTDDAQSGYGKDSFIGKQSSYVSGKDQVIVDVSTVSRSAGAETAITISPMVPETLLYEDSPLYGILYNSALPSTLNLSTPEITLRAEPFDLSTSNPLSGLLTYDWTMNGVTVPAFQNKNEITLRSTGATGSESDVGLTIQHKTDVLQGGQASIAIFQ